MSILKSLGFKLTELKKASSTPFNVGGNVYLVIKCPNCEKIIRFSMAGTYGPGWSMRTFYCKQCQQTHSITMFFEASKQGTKKPSSWINLTQSLRRTSGVRVVRSAHRHLPMGLKFDNPAKMLGYPSVKIARWLKHYVNIYMQHLLSTLTETDLHEIESQTLQAILNKLKYIHNILSYHVKED